MSEWNDRFEKPTPAPLEEHHFRISVRMRSHDSPDLFELVTQEVRAFSLHEALQKAVEIPLYLWFEGEEEA